MFGIDNNIPRVSIMVTGNYVRAAPRRNA